MEAGSNSNIFEIAEAYPVFIKYSNKIGEKHYLCAIINGSTTMKIKMFTLPNMITLANLACGCAAIVLALGTPGNLALAFWFMAGAAVFDFLDGFAARLTGQYSKMGVELDSLADMVSFGVAPAAVLFVIYRDSFAIWNPGPFLAAWPGWIVFAVALFSALRLARFNIDDRQTTEFIGLPTPAAALMIASLGWATYNGSLEIGREIILAFSLLVSYLMICPVRMFSLKFKGFGWHGNQLRYIFLLCSAAIVALLGIEGVAASIILYIVISTVRYFLGLRGGKPADAVEK